MPRARWTETFRSLREKLEVLRDASGPLYHTNLFTPGHGAEAALGLTNLLEPELMGEELLECIRVKAGETDFHGHIFHGDRRALRALKQELKDLHTWYEAIPRGVLPDSESSHGLGQLEDNLVLWANVVYHLAFRFDLWFLAASVEYRERIDRGPFLPWQELKQPPDVDLTSTLVNECDHQGDLRKVRNKFKAADLKFPEVISTYLTDTDSNLCGEFKRASVAAVDALVFMASQDAKQTSGFPSRPTDLGSKGRIQQKTRQKIYQVFAVMLRRMSPDEYPQTYDRPLKQSEIAAELGWLLENGKPNRKDVQKAADYLFNLDGQYKTGWKGYLALFPRKEPHRREAKASDPATYPDDSEELLAREEADTRLAQMAEVKASFGRATGDPD